MVSGDASAAFIGRLARSIRAAYRLRDEWREDLIMTHSVQHGFSIRALGLAVLASLPCLGAAHATEASGQPDTVITGLDQSLLDVMQHAKQLGYVGRYAKLEPVVRQVFDIRYMTRVAVGTSWSALSQDQQDQLSGAFGKFITATYARRFDGYSGETFETLGSKPLGPAILVLTRLVKSDGEPIALNYVTHANDGRWQVVDIFLTGTISELAQRRSEFSAVFQQAGFDGLMSSLLKKIAQAESEAQLS
jgi:phospholipid transport system substrate-binding protein